MKKTMLAFLAIATLVLAVADTSSASLIAAYNETASPSGGTYWPYSIGWMWEAPTDFTLTRIETMFGSGDKNYHEHREGRSHCFSNSYRFAGKYPAYHRHEDER